MRNDAPSVTAQPMLEKHSLFYFVILHNALFILINMISNLIFALGIKGFVSPSEIEKSRTPVCDFIYRDEAGAKFYTGLSQKQRQILWEFLGPAKHNLQVWGRRTGFINSEIRSLSVECQFLLCLIILRRDKAFEECHHLFGISDTVASQVFKTWLSFLKLKFKAVETYVHSLTLKDLPKPPKAFRNKLLRKVRYVNLHQTNVVQQLFVTLMSRVRI